MRHQKNLHNNFLKKISNVKLPPIVSVNGRKIAESPILEKIEANMSRSGSSRIDVVLKTNDSTVPDEMNNTIHEGFEAPTSSIDETLVNYDNYNYNLDAEIQNPLEVNSDSQSLSD